MSGLYGMLGAPTVGRAVPTRRSLRGVQALVRQIVVSRALILAALFLLALGSRLWDLGRSSLTLDELTTLQFARLDFQGLRHALTIDGAMTLYYWVMFAWLRVVGLDASEALVRLPSAVFGALTVPLVYLLGQRLHSSAAGLAAALLLAVNAHHALLSQLARSYALFGCLTVGSYLLLDQAVRRGRRWEWGLHGLLNALALYSHPFAALTVLAQGLFVVSRRSRVALAGLLGSALATAALVVPLAPYLLSGKSGASLRELSQPTLSDLLATMVELSGGSRGMLPPLVGLAVIGIARGWNMARPAGYRNWLLLSWLLVPIILVFAISQVRPILRPKYLFEVLPALPLLAAVGWARLPRWTGWALLGVMTALSLTVPRHELLAWRHEAWREAVAYATARTQPSDGYIFIMKWGQSAFEYYAGWRWGRNPSAPYADVLEPFDWSQVITYSTYRGLQSPDSIEEFAPSHSRIWLIQYHDFGTAQPVRRWLADHGYRLSERGFGEIRLLLYERPVPTMRQ